MLFSTLCPSSFYVIILKVKRDMIALHKLSSLCRLTVSVLWPVLMVPLVGLRCVMLVFSDHTPILIVTLGVDWLADNCLCVSSTWLKNLSITKNLCY